MKNRLISILLMVALLYMPTKIWAQFQLSQDNITKFKSTKTYIVLEGGMFSEFNSTIRQCAQACWTITPYEIISQSQYEQYCKQENCSFMMLVDGIYDLGGKSMQCNVLTIVLGHKSGNIDKMPDVISIPMATYDEDGESNSYGYKMMGILKSVQYLLNHPTTIGSSKDLSAINSGEVKNKTLLLTANDVVRVLNDKEKIKDVYSHPFILTSEKEVEQALLQADKEKAFVHTIGEAGKISLMIIADCSDGTILYGNFRQVKNNADIGLNVYDFKELSR